jgi:predicted RNase H-like nuclease
MDAAVTFIGVDLAWRGDHNHTGIVITQGDLNGARLVAYSDSISSLAAATAYVAAHSTDNTVVAIDAPLIIRNKTGQRPCETEISRRFGRFNASCHTSNLSLYPDPASTRFVGLLAEAGFRHQPDPDTAKLRMGRWLFEVYPHPAHVVLFELDKIIPYKKGRVPSKRGGLHQLQRHLRSLAERAPALIPTPDLDRLLTSEVEELRGTALKHYEDLLDALFCSYLALFYWRWGRERSELVGDLATGCIVVPSWPRTRVLAS